MDSRQHQYCQGVNDGTIKDNQSSLFFSLSLSHTHTHTHAYTHTDRIIEHEHVIVYKLGYLAERYGKTHEGRQGKGCAVEVGRLDTGEMHIHAKIERDEL